MIDIKVFIKVFLLLVVFQPLLSGQTFMDEAVNLGIDVYHDLGDIEDSDWGTGAAWIDYDNDKDLDLLVTNRADVNQFFENNGDGTFTELNPVTLGIACPFCDGAGVSVADYDNDGWSDIYLSNADEDYLLRNTGSSFVNETPSSIHNATDSTRGTTSTWSDYDNDGFLDLFISSHIPVLYWPNSEAGNQSYLFHNDGGNGFTDVSYLLNIAELEASSFTSTWTDFDHDDDLDLIFTNDCPFTPIDTRVFENQGGVDWANWNFEEVSNEIGLEFCHDVMGIGVGDFNRDGWMDLVMSNIGDISLHENNGGNFTNIASSADIAIQDPLHYSWGVNVADIDNDGYQDILVVSGFLDTVGALEEDEADQPNYYFNNDGDMTFTDLSASANYDDLSRSRTSIKADFDDDGDIDIYIVNYHGFAQFKMNNTNNGNHWFKIDLEGVISNRDGVGAKVRIEMEDGEFQYYETRSGSSLGGGDSPYIHFGLGDNEEVKEIKINWPSGIEQYLNDITADTFITIIEDEELLEEDPSVVLSIHDEESRQVSWNISSFPDFKKLFIEGSFDASTYSTLQMFEYENASETISLDQTQAMNYFRLRLLDKENNLRWSNTLSLRNRELVVYPFLASGTLHVIFPEDSQNQLSTYEILDMQGRKMMLQEKNLLRLRHDIVNINNLETGFYILVIKVGDNYFPRRFIKS